MKRSGITSAFGRPLRVLGGLLTLALVVGFGLSSASASTNGGLTQSAWRLEIAHLQVPKHGCFTGSYPALAWREVKCHTAPAVPYAPRSSTEGTKAPQTIGDGYDYSAVVASGSITTATGSFPYITPGSTETGEVGGDGSPTANTYSLQLNTEFFTGSPACDGAATPSSCLAWQQFVYASDGPYVFMQYWLIDYDATCPSNWMTYSTGKKTNDCYANSNATVLSSNPKVSQLETVTLTGTAAANGTDTVVMNYGSDQVSAVGEDSMVDLAGHWTTAEFDIFGDGSGSAATFSSGTTLDVKTAVNNGAATAPKCDYEGFTGETNNLGFATVPTMTLGSEPAIETAQTNTGDTKACARAGTGTGVDKVTVTSPGAQTTTVGSAVSLHLKGADSASGQSLSWSATGLPSGLSISSAGVISGKPTKAGTSSVTVKATDLTGAKGTATFNWVVKAHKVTVTNPGKKTTTVGSAVSLQLKGSDSVKAQTLKWSATGLPSGLSISSSGKITGKPKKAGTSTVTVTAKDASGAKGTAKFTWVIKAR